VYNNNANQSRRTSQKKALIQSSSRGSLNSAQERVNQPTSSKKKGKKKLDLENFQVLKTLGQGSFGIVKLVRDKSDNSFYALKCLSKQAIKSKK
jgi:serine/threonine protein kinase